MPPTNFSLAQIPQSQLAHQVPTSFPCFRHNGFHSGSPINPAFSHSICPSLQPESISLPWIMLLKTERRGATSQFTQCVQNYTDCKTAKRHKKSTNLYFSDKDTKILGKILANQIYQHIKKIILQGLGMELSCKACAPGPVFNNSIHLSSHTHIYKEKD